MVVINSSYFLAVPPHKKKQLILLSNNNCKRLITGTIKFFKNCIYLIPCIWERFRVFKVGPLKQPIKKVENNGFIYVMSVCQTDKE